MMKSEATPETEAGEPGEPPSGAGAGTGDLDAMSR
jgi:hypothetical protein